MSGRSGSRNPQDGERSTRSMPVTQRRDLQCDVRQSVELDEPVQLLALQFAAPRAASRRGLVDNGPRACGPPGAGWPGGASAARRGARPPPDPSARAGWPHGGWRRVCSSRGRTAAVVDHRRGLFHAEIGLEPGRSGGVGGATSPGRWRHEGEEFGALVGVDHAVAGAEVGDVTLLEADTSELQAADLGGRPADGVARLLAGDRPSRLCRSRAPSPMRHAVRQLAARPETGPAPGSSALALLTTFILAPGRWGPPLAFAGRGDPVRLPGIARSCNSLAVARPARSSNSPLRTPAMKAAISARV